MLKKRLEKWFLAVGLMLGLLIPISADPGYLDIRRGAVIPKLLWKDNTFKKNLEIVSVSQTHVVLREGNNYITIRHEHLLSLHETTHQNLTSAKINQAANNLGGAKPGIASKWHLEPGYIFNEQDISFFDKQINVGWNRHEGIKQSSIIYFFFCLI